MQLSLLGKHDLIIETRYLKMTAVMILQSFNQVLVSTGEAMVARLQVEKEMSNIRTCREYFESDDYFAFASHYNLLNRFSLVTHSVFITMIFSGEITGEQGDPC